MSSRHGALLSQSHYGRVHRLSNELEKQWLHVTFTDVIVTLDWILVYPENAVINVMWFWLQRHELVCRLLSSKTVICSQYLWNENKHTRRRNRQADGTIFDANWGYLQKLFIHRTTGPIPVAVWYKARVCGRWLAGIAGSNPAGGMNVCLLSVLCVVKTGRSLTHRSPTNRVCACVRACVWLSVIKCNSTLLNLQEVGRQRSE